MTEDTCSVCAACTAANSTVFSNVGVFNLNITVVYAAECLTAVHALVKSNTSYETTCDTDVTLCINITVVYTVGEVAKVDDTGETTGSHLLVCSRVDVDVTVVYTVDEPALCGNAKGGVVNDSCGEATNVLSVTHNGNVCVVGNLGCLVASGGSNCKACCICIGVVDLALDGEVGYFAGEVSKNGIGYGEGLAVTVENAPEGFCIGACKSDVCCKIVLCGGLSSICGGGNHSHEFVCGIDCGTFGSCRCGNYKGASGEEHHNAKDE